MKVVGYARVSTDRQKNEATIETQVELIKRHCERKGHELVHIYRDDGVSGRTTFLHERPLGRVLLEAARRGEFEAVVVYHPDRLGRKQVVSETVVVDLWDELGIRIFDVNDGTDVTTPEGRLLFTVLSALSAAEGSRFVARSMDATLLHAENGVWLGGIVPYGYRKEGQKKVARLILSTEKIPGFEWSEVEVVEMIYRWSADDKLSCFVIADRLQAMGVPTSYTRDERKVLTNKRMETTANLWRAGRIRNMLVGTYYKGIHQWGKRQKKKRINDAPRPIIERPVPAIVDEGTWERAQQTLTYNRMISPRNGKRQYLLRSKMKCGLCNLTYAGTVSRAGKAENLSPAHRHPSYEIRDGFILRPYYVCTGKNNHRGLYGQLGQRCPSRMVSSQIVEEAVWADIEAFLRNPVEVLNEIQARLAEGSNGGEKMRRDYLGFQRRVEGLQGEKSKLLGAFRKGIIDDETLESALKEIEKDRAALEVHLENLQAEMAKLENQHQQCQTTQQLLHRLNGILDGELTFEVKREIVEALVEWIRVETHGEGTKKTATIQVFYRFENPDANRRPITLTETGNDVRAAFCSAIPTTPRAKKPAPAPRRKSADIWRAFRGRLWTELTSTSKCQGFPARN